MSRAAFSELVDRAWEALPSAFRDRVENVVIVVEDRADASTVRLAGVTSPDQLLGFYHGIPLTGRPHDYGLVAPDKISLYRMPILNECDDVEQAAALVRRVLFHEIAHYFGIDDDRLEEIGAY